MTLRSDETRLSIARATLRRPLVIGLVNNMPSAAFQATAEQFHSLLRQAMPEGSTLHLRLFRPPDAGNARRISDQASRQHEPAEELWTASLDGLIVTGAEPQAVNIADEPCLPFLSQIVGWADACSLPTIWSCLAAHAAVYCLDGIARRQRDAKLFGVFECEKVEEHLLLKNSPAKWTIPHSRHNELSEEDLAACGYQILTRSMEVGVDTFLKQTRASHIFLNGHPEYGQAMLHSEYRRDVRRFLTGARQDYPEIPTGYFPKETLLKMTAFREASAQRTPESISHFPPLAAADMPWRSTAIGLFRNWLLEIARENPDFQRQADVTILSESVAEAQLSPSQALGAVVPPVPVPRPQMRIGGQTL